jgi:hypothetical protein
MVAGKDPVLPVGVPESTPAVLSVIPCGKPVAVQLSGESPPDAVKVKPTYGEPSAAIGSVGIALITGGGGGAMLTV